MCAHACMCVCRCVLQLCSYVCMHACIYACVYACMCVCRCALQLYVCVHACVCANVHCSHVCAYTHALETTHVPGAQKSMLGVFCKYFPAYFFFLRKRLLLELVRASSPQLSSEPQRPSHLCFLSTGITAEPCSWLIFLYSLFLLEFWESNAHIASTFLTESSPHPEAKGFKTFIHFKDSQRKFMHWVKDS